jgi:putative endonuclease
MFLSQAGPTVAPMNQRAHLGRTGEDLAAHAYERDGYEVLERNFRCGQGEIDLVLRRATTVVFCEVKTRSTDFFGDPAEAVKPAKQARLRRLAAVWLKKNPVERSNLRFDVVSVVSDRRGTRVRRLEDAF